MPSWSVASKCDTVTEIHVGKESEIGDSNRKLVTLTGHRVFAMPDTRPQDAPPGLAQGLAAAMANTAGESVGVVLSLLLMSPLTIQWQWHPRPGRLDDGQDRMRVEEGVI